MTGRRSHGRLSALNGVVHQGRLSVQQSSEQLLAGAALAEDEHGGRELGHLVRKIHDLAHDPAGSEDELAVVLVRNLGAQRDDLPAQILPLQGNS